MLQSSEGEHSTRKCPQWRAFSQVRGEEFADEPPPATRCRPFVLMGVLSLLDE
jgi:hypothetical protein